MPTRSLPWLALAAAALLGSCSDSPPTAPAADAPRAASSLSAPVLLECPRAVGATRDAAIGPAGGVLRLEGNRLAVPAGAVPEEQTFQAELPASRFVEVDFRVAGRGSYRFARPVTLTIDYSRCARADALRAPLHVYYVDAESKQILEDLGGVDDKAARRITTQSWHLSDYAVGSPS